MPNGVCAFVPSTILPFCARQRGQRNCHFACGILQVGTRVLSTASSDNLRLINDKARFCQSLDLPLAPAAEFRAVETLAEFDAAFDELRSRHDKLCIKPSSSVFGLGFAVLDENAPALNCY